MPILELDQSIYVRAAIDQTLEVFDSFGSFEVDDTSKDGYVCIKVEPSADYEVDEFVGEFSNYLLAESIKHHQSQTDSI